MKLKKLFATTNWTEASLAKACGVHDTTINRLRTGTRTAGLALALLIERVTAGAVKAVDLPMTEGNRRVARQLARNRGRKVRA